MTSLIEVKIKSTLGTGTSYLLVVELMYFALDRSLVPVFCEV